MRKFLFPVVFCILAGCTTLGVKTATLQDRELLAVSTIQAVEKSAIANLNAGTITLADAENVLKGRDVAIQGLAIVRTMATTDPTGADAKLTSVVAGLTLLNDYLLTQAAKQVKKP